ncbi:hypothetical protein DHEL01_v202161 [Diaporthe helianthi]|uniref:Uncharacterized protein n=1 Tax=Diaporthe helianthi TaxID=158607 RepID=A0A2P5IAB6_DIAHE|nr:hypothetical protein DHEL01_v202161 [Diaporthe helianthi]
MSLHSYYLDDSVRNLQTFEDLFKRAQSFAARAFQRLKGRNDVDFKRDFELIFKTPDRDQELTPVSHHVARELWSFAYDWHRTPGRGHAAVRIYWDGARRYRCVAPSILDPVNHTEGFEDRGRMERL